MIKDIKEVIAAASSNPYCIGNLIEVFGNKEKQHLQRVLILIVLET